jgi:hypothetical protein
MTVSTMSMSMSMSMCHVHVERRGSRAYVRPCLDTVNGAIGVIVCTLLDTGGAG